MAATLSPEIIETITKLGELIKADDTHKAVIAAVDGYERSEELNSLIAEYNTQQSLLANDYSNGEGSGDEFRETVQARIDELYKSIVNHPAYKEYMESKYNFDTFMNAVYEEIQYAVTGQRPCSHDCSSCHSNCSGN